MLCVLTSLVFQISLESGVLHSRSKGVFVDYERFFCRRGRWPISPLEVRDALKPTEVGGVAANDNPFKVSVSQNPIEGGGIRVRVTGGTVPLHEEEILRPSGIDCAKFRGN